MKYDRWLLPEGIDELLPTDAKRLEELRRLVLDLFERWGYQLIIPPFVEYTESLLTGMGGDLDLQTFKLIDQQNGRMMGIRADMTPQAARIDAHRIASEDPQRLCYLGTVLRTTGDGYGGSRSLVQIGAELFGHSGTESDVEIITLMLEMLQTACVDQPYIDLGHVGIFRALAKISKLDDQQQSALFDSLQRKATTDVNALLDSFSLNDQHSNMFRELIWLNGGESTLERAREVFKSSGDAVNTALDELQKVANFIKQQYPDVKMHFDLAELRGLHYHTGVVFSAYQLGTGQAIAQGGRYDDIGKVFGRARPATGFSADLIALMRLSNSKTDIEKHAIMAPSGYDVKLHKCIKELRDQGEIVISVLPGQQNGQHVQCCNRALVFENNQWIVKDID